MINTPANANSIVGFDIDNFIKNDSEMPLGQNATQQVQNNIKMPQKLEKTPQKDVVEIKKQIPKEEKAWKAFGAIFVCALTALISTPFIKKLFKTVK
ncbi:MAG: hypothetical protein E7Z91_02150 [Cyanobacteria bacterium SIG30]|nr:hypothetical protein [Cyanobacteria bacterium SIG30]